MEYTNKKHVFDDRDRRMLVMLLLDGLRPSEIARREKISRERVRQIFSRLGVTFRPVYHIPAELEQKILVENERP